MHRPAHQHLDGLQIHTTGLANSGKNNLQQAAYFLGDFLLDRFRCFFPAASGSLRPDALGTVAR
jgi:hypothetical protein